MEDHILDDVSKIRGQIYLITNTVTKKQYVGQTLTHRKNHERYRPFGFEGRFKDHISEAICNTKKKQCRYLNNSIRHYGKEAFTVELLETCLRNELDQKEQEYIDQYVTFYPKGYNLTRGGKTLEHASTQENICASLDIEPVQKNNPLWRYEKRSEETKKRISEQLKKVCNTEERKTRQMLITKAQHEKQKYDRFANQVIDEDDLEQYIHVKHAKGIPFVVVKVNGKETTFVGKYESIDVLKDRAKEFLLYISLMNCDAAKLTGNP